MVAVIDEKRPADCRLRTVRSLMKIVGRVSPALGARWAERLWFGVPCISLSVQAKSFLKTGSSLNLRWDAGRRCGEGPRVLLVHGWGANAAQFRARWFLHWSPQSTRSSHSTRPATALPVPDAWEPGVGRVSNTRNPCRQSQGDWGRCILLWDILSARTSSPAASLPG